MRPIIKIFFFSWMGLILFFTPLLAEQQGSEFNPQVFKGMQVIMDDFLVNDDTGTADQQYPAIALDGSGNFVISWQDLRNGNYDIYAQRYNSSGATIGTNFKVNDDTGTAGQATPAIAMNASGNFVIAWTDRRAGYWDIYAQRYSSSGTPLGSNFKVSDAAYEYYGERDPAIAMNGNGDFVIVWEDFGNIMYDSDIYGQMYYSDGVPYGSTFKVNDDFSAAGQFSPAVAMDNSGNFIVTWQDTRPNGEYNIYAQRYNSAGSRQDSNFKVNDDTGSAWQINPSIATSDGTFLITWQDYREGNPDIYFRVYQLSGTPLDSSYKLSDDTGTAGQSLPVITHDGGGDFVFVWEDDREGNQDIYAQRFLLYLILGPNNYLVPNTLYASFAQKNPAVAANYLNNYFVWQDNRRGNWDIYAKVVNSDWTEVEEEISALPNKFELSQNYPNPFNPTTTIPFRVGSSHFMVHSPTRTSLIIYNILGQKVRTLVDEEKLPGNYNVIWDGKDYSGKEVASGIYFYQLRTKDFTDTKKMVLSR
jgi:hypothetical protein